ncbi:MAG: hypothetical protein LBU36_01850 [Clostridiales bacterium]|nr:hypothetical protein [Clostridiales bacterium]
MIPEIGKTDESSGGAAIIKDGAFAGSLPPDALRGFLWLKSGGGLNVLNVPSGRGGAVPVEVLSARRKYAFFREGAL